MKVDLGCGKSKLDGYFGVDLFPFKGVNLVQNLNESRWQIPDASCTEINASHVIEHLEDLFNFFREIYRISADGCIINLSTPHYSSKNSWADHTHIKHLSIDFFEPFISGYMRDKIGAFEIIKKRLSFGSLFFTWPARFIVLLLGYKYYERHFAWMFPARNIHISLKCIKR